MNTLSWIPIVVISNFYDIDNVNYTSGRAENLNFIIKVDHNPNKNVGHYDPAFRAKAKAKCQPDSKGQNLDCWFFCPPVSSGGEARQIRHKFKAGIDFCVLSLETIRLLRLFV